MTATAPVTTTWQAPSGCATDAIYQVWSGAESSYIQGPLYTRGSHCFPSGYEPSPTQYYSPAWCPTGYTAACSSLSPVSLGLETETAVICCPTQLPYECPTPTPVVGVLQKQQPHLGCTTTWGASVAVFMATVVKYGKISSTTDVAELGGGITAYGIQVRFKEGDPTLPLQFANLGHTQINDSSSSSTETVSKQAVIGIAVGAAVGALLLAALTALAIILYRRNRRVNLESSSYESFRPPVPPKKPMTPSMPIGGTHGPPYELHEDTSPRASPTIYQHHKHMSMASMASMLANASKSRQPAPVELEAEVPKDRIPVSPVSPVSPLTPAGDQEYPEPSSSAHDKERYSPAPGSSSHENTFSSTSQTQQGKDKNRDSSTLSPIQQEKQPALAPPRPPSTYRHLSTYHPMSPIGPSPSPISAQALTGRTSPEASLRSPASVSSLWLERTGRVDAMPSSPWI
ncbi:uncharacterized protein CTHT_0002880 [Thermochaetoides thermophila DSM 1495]|uniref:Uncharacterized protein n=1 Tax=Chaetomium thermophilum (strain DSM 1495 / CBS 144.50 / IMI 039719) TaxID=759272 RepID=G0RZG5_CHATD|nr:hypothetical protein CTHT_0002880 [Thermochaetoides thermophila DSM 1495]EGS23593.1 hypothetical protein CTHT_0002880 [Thermochaetoides thermophila DSM 1495]